MTRTLVVTLIAGSLSSSALACSLAVSETRPVQAARPDGNALPAPALTLRLLGRGSAGTGSCVPTPRCTRYGGLSLSVATPSATPLQGYQLQVVDGQSPMAINSASTVYIAHGGQLDFAWDDGTTSEQAAIDFTLEVRPVNASGTVGLPQRLRITDPGRAASGMCSAVNSPVGLFWLLAPVFAMVQRRRFTP